MINVLQEILRKPSYSATMVLSRYLDVSNGSPEHVAHVRNKTVKDIRLNWGLFSVPHTCAAYSE